MNIFALCTGRCGSLTFARACSHATNFTVGHETNATKPVADRLRYPDNHIEVDNRLSFMLGKLDEFYPFAHYVHLFRDIRKTAESYLRRVDVIGGLAKLWPEMVLWQNRKPDLETLEFCVDAINENIGAFCFGVASLRHIRIDIDNPKEAFLSFWRMENMRGDLDAALAEFDIKHHEGRRGKEL